MIKKLKISPCPCGCKRPKFYSKLNKRKEAEDKETGVVMVYGIMSCYFGAVKCNVCKKTTQYIAWGNTYNDCKEIATNMWNKETINITNQII